ncbi:MFS transporter [Amycolatopsis sp. CA-230715]|uniref:MFS transporter n=1 Tax=Amycolatopsis sp. CA-230715 TaxID=2745196 RepID=UPI001C015EE3|nr:MFS transporter [Amycolatopsis sp. CA-230715]QWF81728.1 hypothetical protein HUW46_05161 [Amycolatopsis sp. CA-230715]
MAVDQRTSSRNQLAAALTRGPVEVLDFFLPLWAGAGLGASPAAIGALTALETLVSFLVRPIAGALADRYDRGRIAAFGAVLYGLSFAGYAATPSIGFAYGAAVLGGAGGALFWVALRARVGEGLADDSGAFSKLFAAEGAGTWIAFVAGIGLVSKIDYRGVFWLGAAACGLAAATMLEGGRAVVKSDVDAPRFGQLGRRMRPMLGLVVLTSMAEAGVALLLLMHLQRGHHLQLSEIAWVFIPGFMVYSTLPDYLHGVVGRLGRTRVLALAMIGSALFAGALSFAPGPVVIAVLWILSAAAFAAAIPVEQAVVAEAAGVSLGKGMGIYESATLLGATIGTFAAGQLYDPDGRWRWACVGAAVLLLAGSLVVRGAVRRVGVEEFPAPPPVVEKEPEPEPEPESEAPKAEEKHPLRNWGIHAALFLLGQGVLAAFGYCWPVELLFGEAHDANWIWNSSGRWPMDVSRIWCFVFVIDTAWTWGALLVKRVKRSY